MLTETMIAKDLQKVYENDKERILRFLDHKESELRRQLKKGFAYKCAKCYDYSTQNADYKLSLCVYKKRSIMDVYMYIKETNEYVAVTAKADMYNAACIVFTPHYIRRMGERIYGDRDMEINKILTYFILHFNSSICIYHNKRNFVFATNGGISLAIYDEKRNLMLMKTFVSKEMLKSTQIEAFGQVAALIDRFDRFVEDETDRNGNTTYDILLELSKEMSKLNLEEVNEIYGKHFKTKRYEDKI